MYQTYKKNGTSEGFITGYQKLQLLPSNIRLFLYKRLYIHSFACTVLRFYDIMNTFIILKKYNECA